MQVSEREKTLTEWLRENHPETLTAYENYLCEDLGELYFLDLRAWLHREHPDVLTEHDLERYRQSRESLY